jgi:hypothetical protein
LLRKRKRKFKDRFKDRRRVPVIIGVGWDEMGWKGKDGWYVERTLRSITRPGILDCELPSVLNVYSLAST